MALQFNGVDGSLEVANESFFDYERTQAFSASAWVYVPTTMPDAAFFSKATRVGPRGWAFNTIAFAGPVFNLHLVDGSQTCHAFSDDVAFHINTWNQVGFSYDGSSDVSGIKLFLNGNNVPHGVGSSGDTNTLTSGTILNNEPVRIAATTTPEFWSGTISQACLYNRVLTLSEMALLGNIRNLNRSPQDVINSAPQLYLRMRNLDDLKDLSGNGNDAAVVGTTPIVKADPSVTFDMGSTLLDLTTSASTIVTPIGMPAGIAVLIAQDIAATDRISSVTYGGVPLTRVQFAQDSVGEPGASYIYYLGSGIPVGKQTCAITVSAGSEAKRATIVVLTATGDTRVAATAKVEGDTADPAAILPTLPSYRGMVLGVLYSGQDAVGSNVIQSTYKLLSQRDFGSQTMAVGIGVQEGANISMGWTSTIEDVALSAVAIEAVPPVTYQVTQPPVRW